MSRDADDDAATTQLQEPGQHSRGERPPALSSRGRGEPPPPSKSLSWRRLIPSVETSAAAAAQRAPGDGVPQTQASDGGLKSGKKRAPTVVRRSGGPLRSGSPVAGDNDGGHGRIAAGASGATTRSSSDADGGHGTPTAAAARKAVVVRKVIRAVRKAGQRVPATASFPGAAGGGGGAAAAAAAGTVSGDARRAGGGGRSSVAALARGDPAAAAANNAGGSLHAAAAGAQQPASQQRVIVAPKPVMRRPSSPAISPPRGTAAGDDSSSIHAGESSVVGVSSVVIGGAAAPGARFAATAAAAVAAMTVKAQTTPKSSFFGAKKSGRHQNVGAPRANVLGGGDDQHLKTHESDEEEVSKLVFSSFLIAFLYCARTVPAASLAEIQRATAEHFHSEGAAAEAAVKHSFNDLVQRFRVLLSHGANLFGKVGWMKRCRTWRFVFLMARARSFAHFRTGTAEERCIVSRADCVRY